MTRHYASMVLAISLVSVHLLHASTVSKQLNAKSRKQCHTIAQWLIFGCQRSPQNFNGVIETRTSNTGGV